MVKPNVVLDSTHTRIFSSGSHSLEGLDSQSFPFIINIFRQDLPYIWVSWCTENCNKPWAWWFDNKNCYVGFMDQQEAIWFKFKWVG